MNSKQIAKAKKEGKIFAEDYFAILNNLNGWHVGGVPLEFIATSEKFALTHCSLNSIWLSHVLPQTIVVEGEAKSYKEFVNPEINSKEGYHVWLEYTDTNDGIEKVFDPVNFLVVEKDFYHKIEEVKVFKRLTKAEANESLKTKPKNTTLENKYDKYRQVVLLMLFSNFVEDDKGYFSKQLKTRFEQFKSEINYNKTLEDFKTEFNATESKDALADAIDELFFEEAYKSDERSDQLVMFDIIFEHLMFLKDRDASKKETQPE